MISNPQQAVVNIFLKPNGVFSVLAKKNNWSWIPFILLVGTGAWLVDIYFQYVDFDWYVDTLIKQTMADKSPAEQSAFKQALLPDQTRISVIIATIIMPVVLNVPFAAYLNFVTQSDDSHIFGFTDWYGFLWWTQLPALFNVLFAGLIILLSSDNQLMPIALTPFSLSYIFGLDPVSSWFTWFSWLRLDLIWTLYLTVVGIAQWTACDSRKATIIATAPYAIIFALWGLLILF